MANYAQRHSYYVKRTADWLQSIGYIAEKVETNYTVKTKAGSAFVKRDFWGADIACRRAGGVAFIQVKTAQAQASKGVRQLTADDAWPTYVGRFVVWWDKGDRLNLGPNCIIVNTGDCPDIVCSTKSSKTIG